MSMDLVHFIFPLSAGFHKYFIFLCYNSSDYIPPEQQQRSTENRRNPIWKRKSDF